MTTVAHNQMPTNPTQAFAAAVAPTQAAVAAAATAVDAAASVPRPLSGATNALTNTGGVKGAASASPVRWPNFNPKAARAIKSVGEERDNVRYSENAEFDPKKAQSAVIETPRMPVGRSFVSLEGTFDQEYGKGANKGRTNRANAKYVLKLTTNNDPDVVRDVMPEVVGEQEAFRKKVIETSLNLIDQTFVWADQPQWASFINSARSQARSTLAATKGIQVTQMATRMRESPELAAEHEALSRQIYRDKARYPFREGIDEETQQPYHPVMKVDSRVYKIKSFSAGTYERQASGPSEGTLHSCLDNMPAAIKAMATMPGKAGSGFDVREYQSPTFLLKGKKLTRPPIKLSDGTRIPNWAWNPLREDDQGNQIRCYASCFAQFKLTASDTGGYGVTMAWSNGMTVNIFHSMPVIGREYTDYDNPRMNGRTGANPLLSLQIQMPTPQDANGAGGKRTLDQANGGGEGGTDPKRARGEGEQDEDDDDDQPPTGDTSYPFTNI